MKEEYFESDRDCAIRLYKSGKGFLWISKVIGCAHSTVRKWIIKAIKAGEPGLELRSGMAYSQEVKDKAMAMYKERKDLSMAKIATINGVSHNSLRRWLRAEGAEIRSVRPSMYDRDSIESDLRSGMSATNVSIKHDCSESWVYKIKRGL